MRPPFPLVSFTRVEAIPGSGRERYAYGVCRYRDDSITETQTLEDRTMARGSWHAMFER